VWLEEKEGKRGGTRKRGGGGEAGLEEEEGRRGGDRRRGGEKRRG